MAAKGSGTKNFRTPSGGVSANARRSAEKKGDTMPGGSFPIRNRQDLKNAKHDVGRAKNPAAARAFINKRAKEMGAPPIGGNKPKPQKGRSIKTDRGTFTMK